MFSRKDFCAANPRATLNARYGFRRPIRLFSRSHVTEIYPIRFQQFCLRRDNRTYRMCKTYPTRISVCKIGPKLSFLKNPDNVLNNAKCQLK